MVRIEIDQELLHEEQDMLPVLHFEQETSLAKRLHNAGIEHGDTVEVELAGVGVHEGALRSGTALAFCPSSVTVLKTISKGSSQERRQTIPPIVQVSNNLRRRIFETGVEHGFVTLRATVHSNGHIQINGRVIVAEPVDQSRYVHGTTSYDEYREQCASAG